MSWTPKKRIYTPEYISDLTTKLKLWCEDESAIWLGKFASDNGIHRQRLPELAELDEDFGRQYEIAKQIQENKLFMIGIDKNFQGSMPIFALKNVAGWRDTKDIITTPGNIAQALDISALKPDQLVELVKAIDRVKAIMSQPGGARSTAGILEAKPATIEAQPSKIDTQPGGGGEDNKA